MQIRSSLLIAIFAAILISQVATLTVPIDANREECFYEDVDPGAKVAVSFQVAAGGSRDIDVGVYGPDDRAVYNNQRQSDGKFTFVAQQAGVYRVCFSNKMSSVTNKAVSFFIIVGDASSGDFAKAEHLTPLENSVVVLSDGLAAIRAEQSYLKMRERVHRDTTESTNARVKWWGVIQMAVLIVVTLAQVYYLRSLFEVKMII